MLKKLGDNHFEDSSANYKTIFEYFKDGNTRSLFLDGANISDFPVFLERFGFEMDLPLSLRDVFIWIETFLTKTDNDKYPYSNYVQIEKIPDGDNQFYDRKIIKVDPEKEEFIKRMIFEIIVTMFERIPEYELNESAYINVDLATLLTYFKKVAKNKNFMNLTINNVTNNKQTYTAVAINKVYDDEILDNAYNAIYANRTKNEEIREMIDLRRGR